jgi:translation initiation factor IF-3
MEEEPENEKVKLTVVFEGNLNNHNNKGYEVMKLLKKDLESNNHHITVD